MFPSEELIFYTADSSVKDISAGGFAKNILILALAESNSAGNRAFITKVLSAANLDLSGDTLFAEVPAGQPVNCFAGLDQPPKFILVFGLPPAQAGLQANVPLYQSVQVHRTTWLFADALSILEPDRDKKGKLWTALKELFL